MRSDRLLRNTTGVLPIRPSSPLLILGLARSLLKRIPPKTEQTAPAIKAKIEFEICFFIFLKDVNEKRIKDDYRELTASKEEFHINHSHNSCSVDCINTNLALQELLKNQGGHLLRSVAHLVLRLKQLES